MTKTNCFQLLFCWLLVAVMADVPNGWYTAYSKYPEYCSTPAMMQQRKIPNLEDDPRLGETRLVQVTAAIRHGARTPTEGDFECWDSYWDDQATGVWDCDLKAEMAPPTPKHEKQEEGTSEDGSVSEVVTLFEKRYDALMDSKNNLSNHLFGTCQKGQLLLRGYEQQAFNGQILREAYCYDSERYDHDVRMRLMDLNSETPWAEPQLHLRADDDQRTLLSGEILVRSMFETEIDQSQKMGTRQVRIPVHLADRDRDVVGVNSQICPRLAEMKETFEQSSKFQSFNNSKEANELRNFMKKQLKAEEEIDILGCLMPTICTDRPLPQAFGYPESEIFDRMVQFQYVRYNLHLLANNAEFSKLAMAPLWKEIMDNINPIIKGEKGHSAARFALFSGHDDTIAPLMASLGVWNETAWPAYASLFLIEIHEIIDGQTDRSVSKSKFAFRLLYDGQVITYQIEGCLDDAELCDIQVFTDMVSDFATNERDCNTKTTTTTSSLEFSSDAATGGGWSSLFSSLVIVLVGIVAGGAGTSYYLTGSIIIPRKLGYTAGHNVRASSGISSSEGDMSMPGTYSDEPGSITYHDEPEKNDGGITFLD